MRALEIEVDSAELSCFLPEFPHFDILASYERLLEFPRKSIFAQIISPRQVIIFQLENTWNRSVAKLSRKRDARNQVTFPQAFP